MTENSNTQQQAATQPPAEIGREARTFTQDEVNKIVSDRLAREREKLADENSYRAKYEALQKELESIKSAQLHQAKEEVYKKLLLDTGISEKRLALVMRASRDVIDGIVLDETGALTGVDKLTENIKADWADFITTTQVIGAKTPTPPIYTRPSIDEQLKEAFKPKNL